MSPWKPGRGKDQSLWATLPGRALDKGPPVFESEDESRLGGERSEFPHLTMREWPKWPSTPICHLLCPFPTLHCWPLISQLAEPRGLSCGDLGDRAPLVSLLHSAFQSPPHPKFGQLKIQPQRPRALIFLDNLEGVSRKAYRPQLGLASASPADPQCHRTQSNLQEGAHTQTSPHIFSRHSGHL